MGDLRKNEKYMPDTDIDDDYIHYVHKNLRFLRKLYDMTQCEVAERVSIDRSSYAYYESGKTEPSYRTLMRIAKIFCISVDVLLFKDLRAYFQQEVSALENSLL